MDLYNLIISAKLSKGEGGDVSVDPLSVTENGTYTASSGHAYSPVTVSVPTGVFPSGTSQITSNGMYDVTNFASASVNVPGIVPSGTSSITANGIYDITNFASVDVNVSGGGGDHDAEDRIIQRTISGAFTNSRVTRIGNNAFGNCKSLTTVSFPNVTYIGSSAFYYCNALTTVSFPNVTYIGSDAFYGCNSLTTAIFLASSVATMGNANAFNNTPMKNSSFTGSFGSIYVPASLVDTYKTAKNWSVYADRITAYEG